MALAHAADCRKQLVYIDGMSGKLTNLASACVGPFPSSDTDFCYCGKASFEGSYSLPGRSPVREIKLGGVAT